MPHTGDAAPLRLAVAGCGRVFERFHLPALVRDPELILVAVGDTDAGRLAWAGEHLPACRVAGSVEELLASGADALLLLTPPTTHARLAEQALAAGLPVLVEKPMALTLADASAMARAARAAALPLQVGFTRRFRAPYRRFREWLASASTAPERVSFDLVFPASQWRAHDGFLGDDGAGGGVLDDVFSHQADLLRWLLGADIRWARATVVTPDRARIDLGLSNGCDARCIAGHGPYTEYLRATYADGTVLVASGTACWRALGGRACPGPLRARLHDRVALARDKLLRRTGVTPASFALQLRDFAGAIRGRGSMGAGADDGLAAVAAVDACRRSAQSGMWEAVG